jgi:serine/threonine-protein kinase SIK2
MLVLDPTRRYTIEQIKRHRWMMVEIYVESPALKQVNLHACGTASVEPNEQIMQIMQSLGIDMQKTCKSLKVSEILFVR